MWTKRVQPFGKLPFDRNSYLYKCFDEKGFGFSITNYGASLVSLIVPDRNGMPTDVVLGFESVNGYISHDGASGAICGRVANRIEKARFTLNGQQYMLAKNDGNNHLHGGNDGFDRKLWDVKEIQDGFEARLISGHLDEGYPGRLDILVSYVWSSDISLEITYVAKADSDTICNLTNHAYFNLNGMTGSALDQKLQVFADFYTPINAEYLPTGEIRKIDGVFDLREPTLIRDILNSNDPSIVNIGGFDHNFVLRKSEFGAFEKAASLSGEDSGIHMEVQTTLPGIQIYTGNFIDKWQGKSNITYEQHHGVALETQLFPNATSYAHFPSPKLRVDELYKTKTVFAFSTVN